MASFERDLNRLGGNVTATFTTAAYPGQEFRGVVVDTGAVIDEQTRAATVVFQVSNSGRALRIGDEIIGGGGGRDLSPTDNVVLELWPAAASTCGRADGIHGMYDITLATAD